VHRGGRPSLKDVNQKEARMQPGREGLAHSHHGFREARTIQRHENEAQKSAAGIRSVLCESLGGSGE